MTGIDFWFDWAVAAGTTIGTVAMAITTGLVIRQNRKYHQDERRPVCVLALPRSSDVSTRESVFRVPERRSGPLTYFYLQCAIKNIGAGPALRLRLHVRVPSKKAVLVSDELPPLGANESWFELRGFLQIPIAFPEHFNEADFFSAPNDAWEMLLTFEDIFGNKFYTKHPKDPAQPWASLGDGGPL